VWFEDQLYYETGSVMPLDVLLIIIAVIAISVIPVALAGPVAALVFVSAAKKKKLSRFYLFGSVIINILLFLYIVGMHGHSMFGPGDFALGNIAITLVVTLRILDASKNDILQLINDDPQQQQYYAIGRNLIPISQALILLIGCGLITIFNPE
jgi:energy-coupling factor transporter transmembrane protein EcfT